MKSFKDAPKNSGYFQNSVKCADTQFRSFKELLCDPTQYFFIKEIAFYESAEDAKNNSGNFKRIDLSSPESASRNIKLGTEIPGGLLGVYSFDKTEKALSLIRSDSEGELAEFGSRVKFPLQMLDKSILSAQQSYMVVTYRTNITDRILLKLGNLQGHSLVLATDVSVSRGKYVRTEPINIKVYRNPVHDFFGRLRKRWKWDTPASIYDLLYIAPPDETGLHFHSYFEIIYVTEGKVTVSVETKRFLEEKYTLSCGDMLIVFPEYQHNVTLEEGCASVRSIKFLSEVLYPATISLSQVRHYVSLLHNRLDDCPRFTEAELRDSGIDILLNDIADTLERSHLACEIMVQSYIMRLFALLLENYCSETAKSTESSGMLTSSFEKAISAAKCNLYNFTTADAAEAANLSYNYFCTNFKSYYGISFSQYLESLRLREAERLLITTDMSITEIAMSMGFSGASHFIKKFRAAYGTTPLLFRASTLNRGKN